MTQQNRKYCEFLSLGRAQAIEWLESQNYKIIRPFTPRDYYYDAPASPFNVLPANLLKIAILDTETTGTNQEIDRVIELGIVIAEYCPDTGQVYKVLETYNELEDPGMPIPPESIKVHGITDEMVAGKKIIDAALEHLIEDVSLIVAHNAGFDRGFVEARWPWFSKKAWSCSLTQIPWRGEGFGSASLEFLGYKTGFHFSGHRASMDCHALLEVLQSELPVTGVKALKMLLDTARVPTLKLWALNTPFESKEDLKKRKYRWDGDRKTWYKVLSKELLDEEIDWLRAEVYRFRSFKLEQEQMDAYNSFSNRRGLAKIVNY